MITQGVLLLTPHLWGYFHNPL